MDYNQEKIIAEIILKIRFGTATEDEKQQVENWVAEKEEHRLLYEKIVSGKSIAEYLKKEGDVKAVTDIKAVSARVRERIQEKEMGKTACASEMVCGNRGCLSDRYHFRRGLFEP